MPAPDYLSISQIGTFMRCPMQWKLRYIDGIKTPPSAAAVKGTATHEGVESIYLEKKDTGTFSPSTAVEKAVTVIDRADGIEDWGAKGKDGARDTVAGAVSMYIREKLADKVPQDHIEGIEVEAVWSGVSPSGRMFDMKGYIDLLLRDKVVDLKTTSRKKTGRDPQHALQVGFYAMAVGKQVVELQNIVTVASPYIQIDQDSPVEILPNVRRIIGSAHDSIESAKKTGNFTANGIFHTWACSFCGYGEQGLCPDYKLRSPSHE